MSSIVMLVACGKQEFGPDGQKKKGELTADDIVAVEKGIAEQRTVIEEAKQLKAKALGGDPAAAKRWRIVTSEKPPLDAADYVLSRVKSSAAISAKAIQLESIRKEMRQSGWESLRPAWNSAKLGDADAQNEIYDFFTQENLNDDRRVVVKGSAKEARTFFPVVYVLPPSELAQVDVLSDSRHLASYAYLVDLFWTPPAGPWDPFYVEGRYRHDGVEFAPRDWLAKAATGDPRFKAKLAAVDFVSAKDDAERIRAAKALLSLPSIRPNLEGRRMVASCLAAIYCRGISVPVDLSKAADIMLSSGDNTLIARGVKLVCEHNLPHTQRGIQSGHESEGLLYGAYCKYGYGNWHRDFERAYFEYWLFLWRVNGSPGGDANFARMELVELEKQLSAEQIVSLQKKCWIWLKKFDQKSPYYEDWLAR